MLERYKTLQPNPNTIDELKKVLQTIWDDLPQNSINKAILSFVKRLRACVKAGGEHFESLNTSFKLFLYSPTSGSKRKKHTYKLINTVKSNKKQKKKTASKCRMPFCCYMQ